MGTVRPFIAVVDDEESVRQALSRLLRASQIEVEAFATGTAFLKSLKTRRPDCLLLDVRMAGLTGHDVQRQLLTAGIRLPVIIMTAHDDPIVRERCLADGAAAFFYKPIRGDVLLATIESVLGRDLTGGG